MKKLGLIGGMSWESTLEYYRILNEEVSHRLGGLHSAELLMYSVDFEDLNRLLIRKDWFAIGQRMIDAASRLEKAGADAVMICTNTMHKVAGRVITSIDVPLLSIVDATGEAITKAGLTTVGLLGTRFTMEEDFYSARLQDAFGIDVVIPDGNDRTAVDRIIFEELCKGVIRPGSKKTYLRVIDDLVEHGAEGVVLGCTEIPLLIKENDVGFPIFDTTSIHARSAVNWALDVSVP